MRLIFLGPPGAGKGTLAGLLKERLGVAHLSSGDLLREAVHRGDDIGKAASNFIRAGVLVPDDLVTGLMLRLLLGLKESESFVLDGFPRTVEQAKTLDQSLADKGQRPISLVVDFELSPETVVTRLAGRCVCTKCGANYHVDRLPPRKSGICDRCGAPLQSRSDDQPETIGKRLAVYQQQTAPLVAFYRKQWKLRVVSGELEIEPQYQALLSVLKEEQLVRS